MGKRSRSKKNKGNIQAAHAGLKQNSNLYNMKAKDKSLLEIILTTIIQFGAYLSLLTPLILANRYYFPFVGPKSLYFMAFCEIVFFAWLILAIYKREYLPKFNVVLFAFGLFLLVMFLSALLGIDFSQSFWSKFERMTGVLMWLHLFGYFLAISSTFKTLTEWKKLFFVSVFISVIVALLSILETRGWWGLLPYPNSLIEFSQGIKQLKYSDRGGLTLGNTSFLGSYLLFNSFLALYLFFNFRGLFWNKKLNFSLRTFSVLSILLSVLSMYRNGARAAYIAAFGGFALIFLLWLSFRPSIKWVRLGGRVVLGLSVLTVLIMFALLFVPNSFVSQKFVQMTSRARFINWSIAWRGFLERPILGWGPENYILVFPKFFDPCLFTQECGGEIWFDRAHNILFDSLVTIGVVGFFCYLLLFIAVFYVLFKNYLKTKLINFWIFAVFISVLASYFIQNLTVFDMAVSLMMFGLVLGFAAFIGSQARVLAQEKIPPEARVYKKPISEKRPWTTGLIGIIAIFCFIGFIFQPIRTDNYVIKAMSSKNPKDRLDFYRKTLETSSLGKFQIRDFFAQQFQDFLQDPKNQETITLQDATSTLDFLIAELEKTKQESPYDYRSLLRLGHLYSFYAKIQQDKLPLAESVLLEAMKLSPQNQQTYWALAQTKMMQGKNDEALKLVQDSVIFEPKVFNSQYILLQILKIMGKDEELKKAKEEALRINPAWSKTFESF